MARKRRRRNLAAYTDSEGRIRPIRSSTDYDPRKVGEKLTPKYAKRLARHRRTKRK